MIMKNYLILLLFLTAACSGMKNLPKDRAATAPVKVPYSVGNVNIVDLRTDVSAADWRLPLFATRQDEQTVSPVIEGELRQSIMGMITDAGTAGAPAANVTLYIDEAYYRVTGDWKSASEITSFRCRLDFAEVDGGNIKTAQTEASYEYTALNASEKHVKRLFELTARNAVHSALEEIAGLD
jgi:hypothetical protein